MEIGIQIIVGDIYELVYDNRNNTILAHLYVVHAKLTPVGDRGQNQIYTQGLRYLDSTIVMCQNKIGKNKGRWAKRTSVTDTLT
jgi:hypothetical protein